MSNNTNNATADATANSLLGTDHPNEPMAYIALGLFTLTALFHLFQFFKNRAWFLYLLGFGIFMEVVGYWTRLISIKNRTSQGASFIWYFCILLAPSFLAAGCYMTFGRIIYWVTPETHRGFKHLWLPARFLALFFIFWDIVSFCIQVLALLIVFSQISKKDQDAAAVTKTAKTGYNILKVGFIMQMCVFGVFAMLATRFMIVSKQWRYDWPEGGSSSWRTLAWTITGASLLIFLRAIYRLLEFTLNNGQNYIKTHEWTFYIFDTIFLLVVLIAFNVVHPGRYMPHDYCRVGHGFKKPGFRRTPVKPGESGAAGYSRVSLVPPPLAPTAATSMAQAPNSAMNFQDPWNNRVNTPNRF